METHKRELWDRLENEPERAYHAFEAFLTLPSGERTLLGAYRRHVGNPDAAKPSDTWSGWSNAFAWRERAAAYDDHLASVRAGPTSVRWKKRQRSKLARSRRREAATTSL